jgi:hypothetical protein
LLLLCSAGRLVAQQAEQFLPATTKGFVSAPNLEELRTKFNASQLGQLVNDPALAPFIDDLKEQLREKLGSTGMKLGVTQEDVRGICTGELALAAIQPDPKDKMSNALVMLASVKDRQAELAALLAKIAKNQAAAGATRSVKKLGAIELVTFTMPIVKGRTFAEKISYFVSGDQLVVADHERVAEEVLHRFGGVGKETSLAALPAFRAVMDRNSADAKDLEPQLRWFVEPLGYAEVVRAQAGGKKRKGTDILKVLARQGFTAVQAAGGYVFFQTEEHELLHRTFIYAPAVARKGADKSQDKYNLAMRMASFPNKQEVLAQDWIPEGTASYLTFHWNLKDVFHHVGSLVDDLAGEKGVFDEVLLSLEKDPAGPQINVRKELVAHAKTRGTLITDYRLPITTKSERWLVAFEVDEEAPVALGLKKLFENDPAAKERKERDVVIWEINNNPEETELVELKLEGVGFVDTEQKNVKVDEIADEGKKKVPNSAFAVANGHVIMASHVDYVIDLLNRDPSAPSLSTNVEYQRVNSALAKLGAGKDAMRFFAKTDQTYMPTYELLRTGKMPESETLLGKALNAIIPHPEGTVREQLIDASKLPEFETLRQYMGPAGIYMQSEDNGWIIVGCLLKREAETK